MLEQYRNMAGGDLDEERESIHLSKEELVRFEQMVREFEAGRFIYSPNSILHGSRISAASNHDRVVYSQIVIGRLDDFIDYLFNQSEHCGHISHSEAWREFEEWEFKQHFVDQPISHERNF